MRFWRKRSSVAAGFRAAQSRSAHNGAQSALAPHFLTPIVDKKPSAREANAGMATKKNRTLAGPVSVGGAGPTISFQRGTTANDSDCNLGGWATGRRQRQL